MKQIKEFHVDVTCPACGFEEKNKIYKLALGEMNTLNYICPKCGSRTNTATFFVSKDWKNKYKKAEEAITGKKKKLNLSMPRIGKPKR